MPARTIDGKNLSLLVADIKKKKELQEISDEFVRSQLLAFFLREPKLHQAIIKEFNPRSFAYKKIVKCVRAKLRRSYGLFRQKSELANRELLLQELFSCPNSKRPEVIKKILSTHSSTKERLPFYEELYQQIFSLTGGPDTILDLGAGINPFSFPFMKLKKVAYRAVDISEKEVELLNRYFEFLQQENKDFLGRAEVRDLMQLSGIKPADVCFLFKMTDIIEQGKEGHKATEALITKIPAKFIVVSFPTRTMSGRKMNFPRRKWIELMCARLGYSFEVLEFSNEIFYVIGKKMPQ